MSVKRACYGLVLTIALGLLTLPLLVSFRARVMYNVTPSLPIGYYWIVPESGLQIGDLVSIPVPDPLQTLVVERGYLAVNVPLLKRVAALPGDHICVRKGHVIINGKARATALKRDSWDRPMPVWQGCGTLKPGEFFALIEEQPRSFDSRYFGPLKINDIIGKATPLWVTARPDSQGKSGGVRGKPETTETADRDVQRKAR